jgi:hypothetical protein
MSHHWTSGILANRAAWHNLGIVKPNGFRFTDDDVIAATEYYVEVEPTVLKNYPETEVGSMRAIVSKRVPGVDRSPVVLGSTGTRYRVVQPAEFRAYAQKLVDSVDGAQAETAIVLREGRDLVFCVDIGETMLAGESIRTFANLHSEYGGLEALGISATDIATVCANTLAFSQSQHNHRITHNDFAAHNLDVAIAAIAEASKLAKQGVDGLLPLVRAKLSSVAELSRATRIVASAATGVYGLPEEPHARLLAERRLLRFMDKLTVRLREPQNRTTERADTAYGMLSAAFEVLEYDGRDFGAESSFLRATSPERVAQQRAIFEGLQEVYA